MTKSTYKVLRTFGHETLGTVKAGATVELEDKDAKVLAKVNAIGLHFEDDDEPVVEEKPKRAPPKRPRKIKEPIAHEKVQD